MQFTPNARMIHNINTEELHDTQTKFNACSSLSQMVHIFLVEINKLCLDGSSKATDSSLKRLFVHMLPSY